MRQAPATQYCIEVVLFLPKYGYLPEYMSVYLLDLSSDVVELIA